MPLKVLRRQDDGPSKRHGVRGGFWPSVRRSSLLHCWPTVIALVLTLTGPSGVILHPFIEQRAVPIFFKNNVLSHTLVLFLQRPRWVRRPALSFAEP